jgi:hypothetical protein
MVDDEFNEDNHIDVDIRNNVEHLKIPNIQKDKNCLQPL